jgi:oligopeptidase A
MSKKGSTALAFIEDLRDRLDRQYRADDEALRLFVAAKTGIDIPEVLPWNRAYWAEKQQDELYSFNSEELRPYFCVDEVLRGVFSIASTLYGISVRERPTFFGAPRQDAVEVFHPDVRYFEFDDAQNGRLLGSLFADFYAREQKQNGACAETLELGLDGAPNAAYLLANLRRSTGDGAAFLNHDEAQMVFHEFGHVCHDLLCHAPFTTFSAYEAPWDFVELPSQLFENFLWERAALDLFARNPAGEPISDELFERMLRSRTFQAGISLMYQIQLSKLDLELHLNYRKYEGKQIEALDHEILANYRIPRSVQANSYLRSFNHIFAEPLVYASGYYSYLWAMILDADAFTKFKADGVISAEVGGRFRREVLEKGSTEDADVLF